MQTTSSRKVNNAYISSDSSKSSESINTSWSVSINQSLKASSPPQSQSGTVTPIVTHYTEYSALSPRPPGSSTPPSPQSIPFISNVPQNGQKRSSRTTPIQQITFFSLSLQGGASGHLLLKPPALKTVSSPQQ